MGKDYEKGLFIFRRDFRIHDNVSLFTLAEECKEIYCCFFFTPEQVDASNKYKSDSKRTQTRVGYEKVTCDLKV